MPKEFSEQKEMIFAGKSMYIIKDSPFAVFPSYAHPGDAGLDLVSVESVIIRQGETLAVSTGLKIKLPENTVGLICPRSGLSIKGISVANAPGILDSKYQGIVKVILINRSSSDFMVNKGDRIAQLVVTPFISCSIEEKESFEEVSERGEGGFGSSGRF